MSTLGAAADPAHGKVANHRRNSQIADETRKSPEEQIGEVAEVVYEQLTAGDWDKVRVNFIDARGGRDDCFLNLSEYANIDILSNALGAKLLVPPSHLRFILCYG